jgi:hypothetical protein
MGQYYITVNLDRREYLYPHKLGDGLKLMEFGCSSHGTLMALAVLLASGNGRGGGDCRSDSPMIGSWAGNRIVIAGDYGDPGKFVEPLTLAEGQTGLEPGLPSQQTDTTEDGEAPNLYQHAKAHFTDISLDIRKVLEDAGEDMGRRWDS